MEQVVAISIFAVVVVIGFVAQMSMQSSAVDPANASYATPDNLDGKLNGLLDMAAEYTVFVVRQSGNYDRAYEYVRGHEVAAMITKTLKRAKIDAVSISQNSKRISVYRTAHSHSGRKEGRKVGGFHIVKQS